VPANLLAQLAATARKVLMMNNLVKVAFVVMLMNLLSTAQANQLPDYALASMLATKSKSLVTSRSHSANISYHSDRSRSHRGSVIDPSYKEAQCGGVAIGNVRPDNSGTPDRKIVVYISGNVINTGNQC
jgi:hypothetical protein